MNWFNELVFDLQNNFVGELDGDTLQEQLEDFCDAVDDQFLKKSYPKDLSKFSSGVKFPQPQAVDLILSFLSKNYPNIETRFAKKAKQKLLPVNNQSLSNFDLVIIKEKYRRLRKQNNKNKGYWQLNFSRIIDKYSGLYALIRYNSSKDLCVEPFRIGFPDKGRLTLPIIWSCADTLRCGDFWCNSNSFCGITVNFSTDEVIEPVSFNILRAKRPSYNGIKSKLILSGRINGWKDDDNTILATEKIILIKNASSKKTTEKSTKLDFKKNELQFCSRVMSLIEYHTKNHSNDSFLNYFQDNSTTLHRHAARDVAIIFKEL